MMRIGLSAQARLEDSLYRFLYEKNFDWAVVVGSIATTLPCVASTSLFFLAVKALLFFSIVFLCALYLSRWRGLQSYYGLYNQAIERTRELVRDFRGGRVKPGEIREFARELTECVQSLAMAYRSKGLRNSGYTFVEFLREDPGAAKPLLDLLNRRPAVTVTSLGLGLGMLVEIMHLRSIPRLELSNYRRLLLTLVMVFIFFVFHAVDVFLAK